MSLSLIESGAFDSERTTVNPLAVLEETLKGFHARFDETGVRIETDKWATVTVMADGDRLKRLFSNLLENTLRYAHAPGLLKISHQLASGHLLLHFEDSGPRSP